MIIDIRTPKALTRTTAIAGLASVFLVFGAQGLIQVGGGEPPFDAPANDIANFFATRDPNLFPVGSYLSLFGVIAMLWFFAGLYSLMKADWRAGIALASGITFVAIVSVGGWDLVAFRAAEGVDPQLSRFGFDMGNLWFANGWVALGSFAIATGWALLSTRSLPGWLGWWAIVAGLCLVAARAVWTTPVWLIGYGLYWVWVTVLCVMLLRRLGGRDPLHNAGSQ